MRYSSDVSRCGISTLILVVGCSRAAETTPATVTSVTTQPSVALPPAPSVSALPPAPSPSPTPSASIEPPPPAVEVISIGMHIGGGPNDDANKNPLLASIAPHHPALAQCWASLPKRPKLELGIDAHIPAKGGRAKIDNPRCTVTDKAFLECALGVFRAIDFVAPKSGLDTTVSTSVRMTPKPSSN